MAQFSGLLRACLLSGPVFMTSLVLGNLYLRLPQPIEIRSADVAGFGVLLLLSAVFGTPLSAVPNFVGAAAMRAIGRRIQAFRLPIAWILAGAGVGGAFSFFVNTGEMPGVAFALVATSAICARLSHADAFRQQLAESSP